MYIEGLVSRLQTVIKLSSQFTLLQCSVGDELQIRVGGDFFYAPPTPNSAANLLLIAGGVGINPLVSMLRHHIWLLSKATPSEDCRGNGAVRLLYSAKNEKELIFKVSYIIQCTYGVLGRFVLNGCVFLYIVLLTVGQF